MSLSVFSFPRPVERMYSCTWDTPRSLEAQDLFPHFLLRYSVFRNCVHNQAFLIEKRLPDLFLKPKTVGNSSNSKGIDINFKYQEYFLVFNLVTVVILVPFINFLITYKIDGVARMEHRIK